MEYIQIGGVKVSRFILGSNPFSGFSHQGAEMDLAMVRYYTAARVKETIRAAESLGINRTTLYNKIRDYELRQNPQT